MNLTEEISLRKRLNDPHAVLGMVLGTAFFVNARSTARRGATMENWSFLVEDLQDFIPIKPEDLLCPDAHVQRPQHDDFEERILLFIRGMCYERGTTAVFKVVHILTQTEEYSDTYSDSLFASLAVSVLDALKSGTWGN